MPSKKKIPDAEAARIVTDLQTCQAEVEAAKVARDQAAAELAKVQEKYRLAVNRLEAAVQARDEMLASTIGST